MKIEKRENKNNFLNEEWKTIRSKKVRKGQKAFASKTHQLPHVEYFVRDENLMGLQDAKEIKKIRRKRIALFQATKHFLFNFLNKSDEKDENLF